MRDEAVGCSQGGNGGGTERVSTETSESYKKRRGGKKEVVASRVQAYCEFLTGVFSIEDEESGEFYDTIRGRKILGSITEQVTNEDALKSREQVMQNETS